MATTPNELLTDLAVTRVGLFPSPIQGIGVFALCDIPVGTRDLFAPPQPWLPVPEERLIALPRTPAGWWRPTACGTPAWTTSSPHGFRVVDVVSYLNHSATPNLRHVDSGDYFEMTRDLLAGEELTIDYGTLETG